MDRTRSPSARWWATVRSPNKDARHWGLQLPGAPRARELPIPASTRATDTGRLTFEIGHVPSMYVGCQAGHALIIADIVLHACSSRCIQKKENAWDVESMWETAAGCQTAQSWQSGAMLAVCLMVTN